MLLIPLEGYTPSIGRIWTNYRIEEALSSDGPWASIQSGVLLPADTDPNAPLTRNFSVTSDVVDGWYRVVFIDVDSNFENTIPRWNRTSFNVLYTPTVSQVGALLRARTKDTAGNEIGTFTEATRPTAEDVNELIQQAIDTVAVRAGEDVPPKMIPETQRLVALRAAMLVELGYFGEQVTTGRSPYGMYKEIWDDAYGTDKSQGTLMQAITAAKLSGGDVNSQERGLVSFSFPSSSNLGSRRL